MYPYLRLSDLRDADVLVYGIYNNREHNYYIADDWSPAMYDALACAGFVTVSAEDQRGQQFLIPEMQFSYAVLHWPNLHVSKKLRKFIRRAVLPYDYTISINRAMGQVFDGLAVYHERNWLYGNYADLFKHLAEHRQQYKLDVVSVELWDGTRLIGGEIGYLVGGTYTSLTGFFDREAYSNFGNVQLICLAQLLQRHGYRFWNMGHPYMDYKFALGAVEYDRFEFLRHWLPTCDMSVAFKLDGQQFTCRDLLANMT